LGADAKAVFMNIYDGAGNYVKTIESGAKLLPVAW